MKHYCNFNTVVSSCVSNRLDCSKLPWSSFTPMVLLLHQGQLGTTICMYKIPPTQFCCCYQIYCDFLLLALIVLLKHSHIFVALWYYVNYSQFQFICWKITLWGHKFVPSGSFKVNTDITLTVTVYIVTFEVIPVACSVNVTGIKLEKNIETRLYVFSTLCLK